ncbi:MAG: LytR C-terminal domain-containing protein, partial [Actinomycetes bacterium]
VGAGQAVAEQLAILDVNLPPPTNADTFDYRQTQILAGSQALPLAEDIRAILGRGVVLDGADLPADTVVVIVGADAKNTEPKDQP